MAGSEARETELSQRGSLLVIVVFLRGPEYLCITAICLTVE